MFGISSKKKGKDGSLKSEDISKYAQNASRVWMSNLDTAIAVLGGMPLLKAQAAAIEYMMPAVIEGQIALAVQMQREGYSMDAALELGHREWRDVLAHISAASKEPPPKAPETEEVELYLVQPDMAPVLRSQARAVLCALRLLKSQLLVCGMTAHEVNDLLELVADLRRRIIDL